MMKKSLLAVFATLCTLFALSGAPESVPVVWNSPNKTFRDLETYAFGFAQTENEYKFMFQIKSLDTLLESDLAMLTLYVDSDNNKDTGRFKGQGWDLQLNVLLKRQAVSAVVWSKGEIKSSYSFREGEFSVTVQPDDNMLTVTVKKVIFLKNISIGRKFVLFEEHVNGQGKVEKALMEGVEIKLK
ncbi:MAG: hypothetical protein J6331_01565 [Lentisphaeria bacterium]|nr:hypothetical protein [Lentisphaeria bacterium]